MRDDEPGTKEAVPRKRRSRRLRGRGLPSLQLEPPGSHVPALTGTLAALGPLRLGAAGAAGVLALSSTGHVLALAVLLAVLVAQPAAVGAVLLAGIAILQRWGSPSLEAVAGAQSVLGPGGLVGPQAAAASAWLAGIALVLAAARPTGIDPDDAPTGTGKPRLGGGTLVTSLALGAAAAAAVAGPDFSSAGVLRLATTIVAVSVATIVASLRLPQVTAALALVAGLLAAGLATAVASGRLGL